MVLATITAKEENLHKIGLHAAVKDWKAHTYKYEVYCDRCQVWIPRSVVDRYTTIGSAGILCCKTCNGRIRQRPRAHHYLYKQQRARKFEALGY